jgi:nucleoside-diphosphate-sugar epimerase
MDGRIVVTGASGFIGRALVAHLANEGREVVTLSRAELASGDGSLENRMTGSSCLVHLAARAHNKGRDEDFEADVVLTQSLVRLAVSCGVRRFVYMSSIGVLGTSTQGKPLTEACVPAPAEPYARAKLRAEQTLQSQLSATDIEWVILRPPMVHGPGAPGNFARLLRAVQRGWPLPLGSVHNRRSLVGIDNLVDAVSLCIDHPAAARQVFLVADGEPVSTPELVTLIAQGLGTHARLWKFPPAILDAAARTAGRGRIAESLLADLEIDGGHIRRTLGWTPQTGAREGIVQAAAASRT